MAHFFITQGAHLCDEDDIIGVINDIKVELANEYDPRRLQVYQTLSLLETLNTDSDILSNDLYSILKSWDPYADTTKV